MKLGQTFKQIPRNHQAGEAEFPRVDKEVWRYFFFEKRYGDLFLKKNSTSRLRPVDMIIELSVRVYVRVN
jgi:hypothetical protein